MPQTEFVLHTFSSSPPDTVAVFFILRDCVNDSFKDRFETPRFVSCCVYNLPLYHNLTLLFKTSPRTEATTPPFMADQATRDSVGIAYIIIEYLAKEIEHQSEWADWFLICSFSAFYCHIITFVKIMGYLQDVGAADALLSLGVVLSSRVLQGPNLRFLGSIIVILAVMLREHRASLKEKKERKSNDQYQQVSRQST